MIKSPHAYYTADIATFVAERDDAIAGALSRQSEWADLPDQKRAWQSEISLLKAALAGLNGAVFLEFNVPRIGSRIDALCVIECVVFVLEFKVGESEYQSGAIAQVWDYALDLKNFYKAGHDAHITPVLIATEASAQPTHELAMDADRVFRPLQTNAAGLSGLISAVLEAVTGSPIDLQAWADSFYEPTPTIVEAAQRLYAQHSVEEIARHDAGARNLRLTSRRVEELIEEARQQRHKKILFVTGVPGAGKTLVGLNVATRRRATDQPTHAVFLSGNGPLVAVLREALTRDEVARLRLEGQKASKARISPKVKSFIQNVHHFRDAGLKQTNPPADRVVVFDEAQRAWDRIKTAQFMKLRKGISDFDHTEPEFLTSYLDRHDDWAVIVCLVGGGQEINTGEAGIAAWIDAARTTFTNWRVHISPELNDSEYAAGQVLESLKPRAYVNLEPALHLSTSMRSFRSERVSEFVKAVLDQDAARARAMLSQVLPKYPIVLTRDLNSARSWLRDKARGSERFGLVASSSAQRLKPLAIDVRVAVDPIDWFLGAREDTRSSYFLEDVATEFQVQGLELDWVGVTWDADLRVEGGAWTFNSFIGTKWNRVNKSERQRYLLNAYRVLLTRARQGMVIFVPHGDASDRTRCPTFYDCTFRYLAGLGIPLLDG